MSITRYRSKGATEQRATTRPTTLAGYGITDAATDADLAAHEADTTSVHGITDTSQVALKNAANTFTSAPQTITGSGELLRINSTGTGAAATHYIAFRRSDGTRVGFVGDGTAGAEAMMVVADTGFQILFRINIADCLSIDTNTNVVVGSGALATTATNGFLYVGSCAGAPTGVPTAKTGRVPLVVDTTNHRAYFYYGGAWKYTNLL